ncbi:hypothetical protein AB0H12_10985 [Actinosynnema sp. NPDC023794]
MLAEALIALAAAGGTALVEAATTDAWQKAKSGFARMLGRGDEGRVAVIEGRLESTRAELEPLSGVELERAREVRAAEWTTRLRDTLEEHPDSADALREVLDELAAAGVAVSARTGDHSLVVGRDMSNVSRTGGVSAGVIHGNVSTSPNPPQPGAGQG